MTFEKKEFKVLSSDNTHTLAGIVYLPEGEAKGFFHVVHGMTEHISRYDIFMSDMAKEGWLCFGYDNLGHGNTVNDDSELGYIAAKNGYDLLARDVKVFSDAVIAEYGKEGMKYCLMGHSMGSFIVRYAAEKYVSPDKLIVMGTGSSNPMANIGLALIEIIKLFKGDKHISKFIDKMAFGGYNKRFEDELADNPNPWLTTNKEIRERYLQDKYCSFKFTVSAMGDLIRIMKYSNRKAWYKNLRKDLHVLLVAGEEDPVGNYGKGVIDVYNKLRDQGINADCILYSEARHEILNDFTYECVKNDIMNFCKD